MNHVLAVLVLLAGYIAYVLVRPHEKCPCTRRKRRRSAGCPKCKGTGIRFRLPVRLVHACAAAGYRYWRARQEDGQ